MIILIDLVSRQYTKIEKKKIRFQESIESKKNEKNK